MTLNRKKAADKKPGRQSFSLLAYISSAPSNRVLACLAAAFTLLALLEISAYTIGGLFSYLASRIWLLSVMAFFAISLKNIIVEAADDIRRRNWLPIAVLAGIGLYLFWGIGRVDRVLDYETAQQLTDGLNALSKSDLGYTSQAAFWGYPARQYVILALPGFLFGRNMFTAHFSFDCICFIGFATLYVGAKRYLMEENPRFVRFSVLFPLLVMCSPIIVTYITFHEQTILPPAYAMLAIGWFLTLAAKFSFESLLCLAVSGAILGSMYTPGLSMSALLVFMLIWIAIHGVARYAVKTDKTGFEKKQLISRTLVLLSIALYTGITLLMSFLLISHGDSLRSSGVDPGFIIRILGMVLLEKPFGLVRVLTPVLIIYIILAFLGLFKKLDIMIIIWVCTSLMAALLMHGSNTGEAEYIQRVMVIVPVIMFVFGLRLFEVINRFVKRQNVLRAVCACLISLVTLISIANVAFPPTSRDPQYTPHKAASRNIAAETTLVAFNVSDSIREHNFNDEQTTFLYFGVSGWDSHVRHLLDYLAPNLDVHVYYGDIEYTDADIRSNNVIIIAREGAAIPPDITDRFGASELISTHVRGNELKFRRIIAD